MSNEATLFRAASSQDGAALLALHRRAIEKVAARDYAEEVARSWAQGLTAEGYARSMAGGEAFEVAIIDGRLVGFCGIKGDEVCGLYVDPDYMRRGVASALLGRALQRMSRQGQSRVRVTATRTGVPFYRRHGFLVVREHLRTTRGGLEMAVIDERQV